MLIPDSPTSAEMTYALMGLTKMTWFGLTRLGIT
jgi:hypothetical protein